MKLTFVMLWAIGLYQFVLAQDSTVLKLEELMNAYGSQDKFSGSVLVARQGKVLLKGGYGLRNIKDSMLNDVNTVYQIASITKTFTSTMILKLVEERKLSLSDKVSKFYPGYPRGDSITIEHLLTHTSGIWDYTRDDDFRNNKQINGHLSVAEVIAFFKDKPLDFTPGTAWGYSNSGYYLLGYLIQQLTGMSYEKAVRKYIFDPLGMTNSGFDFKHLVNVNKAVGYYADSTEKPVKPTPLVDSAGPYAAGAIYSTVEDLYKWHRGLQQHAIVSKASLQRAYAPFKNRYGYGWITDSLKGKLMVSHSGGIFGFRTDFARIPEDDVCIILLSNTEIPGLGNITRRLLAVLYDLPYVIPVQLKVVAVPEAILKRYIGTYKIERNGVLVDVVLENGRLLAKPHNGPVSELLALDDAHFFLANEHEFRISFESDDSGRVVRMMVNPDGSPKPAPKIK